MSWRRRIGEKRNRVQRGNLVVFFFFRKGKKSIEKERSGRKQMKRRRRKREKNLNTHIRWSSYRWWRFFRCRFLRRRCRNRRTSCKSLWNRGPWRTSSSGPARWPTRASCCGWTRRRRTATGSRWPASTTSCTGRRCRRPTGRSSTRCRPASGPPACRSREAGSTWRLRIPGSGPTCGPPGPVAASGPPLERWTNSRFPVIQSNQ